MELGAFYSQGVALGIIGEAVPSSKAARRSRAAEAGFRPLAALGSPGRHPGSGGASVIRAPATLVVIAAGTVADRREFAAAVGPQAFPRLARDLHAVLGRQLAAGWADGNHCRGTSSAGRRSDRAQ